MKKHKALIRVIVCAILAAAVYFIGRRVGWVEEIPKIAWNPKAIIKSLVILFQFLYGSI